MSSNEQASDIITDAIDALALATARGVLAAQAQGLMLEPSEAHAVGTFLLAYRRDRDERAAVRARGEENSK